MSLGLRALSEGVPECLKLPKSHGPALAIHLMGNAMMALPTR